MEASQREMRTQMLAVEPSTKAATRLQCNIIHHLIIQIARDGLDKVATRPASAQSMEALCLRVCLALAASTTQAAV